MRTKDFIGSAIGLIIFGAIFLYTQSGVEDCSTSLGQIGQFLSGNINKKCQLVSFFNFISAITSLGFVILLIYHAAIPEKSKIH